ncbi:MAG: hypothetical protein ABWK15_09240 [Dissulfuribacterales bacterium]
MKGWIQQALRPETFLKARYMAFKALLQADTVAHEALAALQDMAYSRQNITQTALLDAYEHLRNAINDMIDQLLLMAPSNSSYRNLLQVFQQIDTGIRDRLIDRTFVGDMRPVMNFIDHLNLTNASNPSFEPSNCRSLHDIIRFVHEKAILEMFSSTARIGSIKKGTKRLETKLPFELYLIDIGGGLTRKNVNETSVDISAVRSVPLLALWNGMSHANIQWVDDRPHFDWKAFAANVSAEGIANPSSSNYASYAIISADYMNLNIKFGYHFSVIDSLCAKDASHNYILFSFTGGGAELSGRMLRINFLTEVLTHSGFDVTQRQDNLQARINWLNQAEIQAKLQILGRLLAVTRLMDMIVLNKNMAKAWAAAFLKGKNDFMQDRVNNND